MPLIRLNSLYFHFHWRTIILFSKTILRLIHKYKYNTCNCYSIVRMTGTSQVPSNVRDIIMTHEWTLIGLRSNICEKNVQKLHSKIHLRVLQVMPKYRTK